MRYVVLHSCEECNRETAHTIEDRTKVTDNHGYVCGETYELSCTVCGEGTKHQESRLPEDN